MDFLAGFKTYIGVAVAAIVAVGPFFGLSFSESDFAFVSEGWDTLIEAGALLFAGSGRLVAKT